MMRHTTHVDAALVDISHFDGALVAGMEFGVRGMVARFSRPHPSPAFLYVARDNDNCREEVGVPGG